MFLSNMMQPDIPNSAHETNLFSETEIQRIRCFMNYVWCKYCAHEVQIIQHLLNKSINDEKNMQMWTAEHTTTQFDLTWPQLQRWARGKTSKWTRDLRRNVLVCRLTWPAVSNVVPYCFTLLRPCNSHFEILKNADKREEKRAMDQKQAEILMSLVWSQPVHAFHFRRPSLPG